MAEKLLHCPRVSDPFKFVKVWHIDHGRTAFGYASEWDIDGQKFITYVPEPPGKVVDMCKYRTEKEIDALRERDVDLKAFLAAWDGEVLPVR